MGLALALGLAPGAARASEPTQDAARDTFAFTLENNLFSSTDRYYTSGFQFTWRSGT